MKSPQKFDMYINRAYVTCTQSAANTITFEQIRWSVGTFSGFALELQKIEWYPGTSLAGLVASTDGLDFGLVARNDLTGLDPTDQSVFATKQLIGIGATVEYRETPYITNFADVGGLLVPPNPMYMAVNSAGLAAAATVRAIIYYRFKKLTDKESIEVLQTILPGNV